MTPALVGAFFFGAVLGAAHFVSLWWCVALMRRDRAALGVVVQALRFVLLAAALALIARQGANLFLSAAAGVIVVRLMMTRRARSLA